MYSNELVCNILDYLDKNMYSTITIDLISSIFCYDKFYIMKRFKKELGISIVNYVNAIKIHNSLKYFKNDDSILKISLESGFNSLEYFSEIFKKVMGVSPITYKKFIRYDLRITDNDIDTIINSMVGLEALKSLVSTYRLKLKPKDTLVKKLSLEK